MSLHLPEPTGCARDANHVSLAIPTASMATHTIVPTIQTRTIQLAGESAAVAAEAVAIVLARGIACADPARSS
jgi:hypothetical protein